MKYIALFIALMFCFQADAQTLMKPCVQIAGSLGNSCNPVTSSNPLPVTIAGGGLLTSLGTSAASTNPSRSGDRTTGLYTSGSGNVSISGSGTAIASFSPTLSTIVNTVEANITGGLQIGNQVLSFGTVPSSFNLFTNSSTGAFAACGAADSTAIGGSNTSGLCIRQAANGDTAVTLTDNIGGKPVVLTSAYVAGTPNTGMQENLTSDGARFTNQSGSTYFNINAPLGDATFDSAVTTGTGLGITANHITTGTVLNVSSSSGAGGANGSTNLININSGVANTNSNHTTYGINSSISNTGTTSVNVGGYFNASGATTNYGVIVAGGLSGFDATSPQSAVSVNGGVAIGTTYANATAAGNNNLIVQGGVAIGSSTISTGTVLDMGTATSSMLLPTGTTGQRASRIAGMLRYSSTFSLPEIYNNSAWVQLATTAATVASFSAGTTGLTPNTATTGAVTLAGVLGVANGGTNCSSATITCFNNITGFSAAGTTGTTSTNLVFSTSPTLVTPVLGAATGTSLALGGATLGANAFAVTGHTLIEGVTSTGATGTGNIVYSGSPSITTPTFVTNAIDPLLIGGSSGNDTLTLESTSSATHTTDSVVIKTGAQATAATVATDGGLFMAGATGSSKGAGTINATGVYVNGTALTSGSTTSLKKQVFTTSGTFTSDTTTNNPLYKFTLVAGGAGGGTAAAHTTGQSASGGGAAGGTCIEYTTLTSGTGYTVTVGAGGAGGSAGSAPQNGAAGNDSTVVIGATTYGTGNGTGAHGGQAAATDAAGLPGYNVSTSSNCTINIQGGDGGGGVGTSLTTVTGRIAGTGGASLMGGGTASGNAAGAYGSGGAGITAAGAGATSGANGAGGIVIVEWVN